VLTTFGSLGDLHPFVAIGLELRERGHAVVFATLEYYREKIAALGFEFHPVRPDINPDDVHLARDLMDLKTGTERLLREFLFPAVRDAYADLRAAVTNADAMIAGEVVFAAPILAEKTGIKFISTSLAPASFLSAYDPFVPPTMPWLEKFRFLGAGFHKLFYAAAKKSISGWSRSVKEFRRELGLNPNVDPLFQSKFSSLLHLALFSKVLGAPQPDWHPSTVQTGFCFYDGRNDLGAMPDGMREFLDAGEPPIVFTLGSAAVWAADDFFEQSAAAAKKLNVRAALVLGENAPPQNLPPEIAVFEYAPYGEVFPRASAVVHQGGIGTTAQTLRAGVPQLVVPFSHDQPDNAARCVRLKVARTVRRARYNAQTAETALRALLENSEYERRANAVKNLIDAENGVKSACDAIEAVIKN
jgi:rhamnosyltransferase subunit B